MAKHATLSASSADRWLHCPPSARLNEKTTDFASSMHVRSEAHALCEFRLKLALGMEAEDPIPDLSLPQEMEDAAEQYVDRILEALEAVRNHTDSAVLIEQRLDFSDYVPGGFGTADCVILADKTLHLFDMKYGTASSSMPWKTRSSCSMPSAAFSSLTASTTSMKSG